MGGKHRSIHFRLFSAEAGRNTLKRLLLFYYLFITIHSLSIEGFRTDVYHCSRSGVYQSKPGSQKETGKIGHNCLCTIEAQVSTAGPGLGQVIAKIYIDHYGHPLDCKFLRIPSSERKKIVADLAQKKTVNDVRLKLGQQKYPSLISVNANVSAVLKAEPSWNGQPMGAYRKAMGEDVQLLINLISPKYLNNLRRRELLAPGMLHEDDGVSVDLYIAAQRKQHGDNSPVIFYNPTSAEGYFSFIARRLDYF